MKSRLALIIAASLIAGLAARAMPAMAAASISGVAWLDLSYNGVREADEPGAANVALTLTGPTAATVLTRSDGSYQFDPLLAGEYSVSIISQPYFGTKPKVISGNISQSVTLGSDASTTLDFGLVRPSTIQRGTAYVNGLEAVNPVVAAFVGPLQCAAEPQQMLVRPHTGPGAFILYFVPPALAAGCGPGGEPVRFTIDGRPANETAAYPPGGPNNQQVIPPNLPQPEYLELTVGPRAAVYTGQRPWKEAGNKLFLPVGEIRALIGGVDCGVVLPSPSARISVLPAELRAGCGVEGAVIDFYFGDVKTNETLRWTAGFHDFKLTVPESELYHFSGERYQPAAGQGENNAASPANEERTEPSTGAIRPPDTGDAGLR